MTGARRDRFFVPGTFEPGSVVTLDESDARKLAVVLRKRAGDEIEIFDSGGRSFSAVLSWDGRTARARLEVLLEGGPTPLPFAFTLAQSLPKGQKMDFIVEKMTELGATAIVPFVSRRSAGGHAGDTKLERWRRLAKTAAQQCGRSDVPRVAEPLDFTALLASFTAYDVILLPWEGAGRVALRTTLPELIGNARSILALVGPEGGFAHDEVEAAAASGAHPISLGSRILRTETAGLVVLAASLYERAAL